MKDPLLTIHYDVLTMLTLHFLHYIVMKNFTKLMHVIPKI